MEIQLKYGNGQKRLVIPEKARVSTLSPAGFAVVEDLEKIFEEVMDHPLGISSLEKMDKPRTVAIAVPDESRPTPVKILLPLFLKRLYWTFPKLKPEQVVIVVAAGLHPPLDETGIRRIVPKSVAPGCRVVSHDAVRSHMADCGRTSRGTPVLNNADFAGADLKVVIGNIDPHQFVGFTGGAKGAAIGCGAKQTIEANHALMFHEKACVGNIEGNPVRADIDEAGRLVGLHLVINVVLDGSYGVVRLLAGEPVAVYQEGAKTCAAIYGVAIREQFDIAVASCGGHPKDLCLYQAQKGLAHTAEAVKLGGKILLMAACPQGVGDEAYFEYVSRFSSPEAVLQDFRRLGFQMGAHKAFLFARTLVDYDVALSSDIQPEVSSRCHLKGCDPQETINDWVKNFLGNPTVAVIPSANTTYFSKE